MSSKFDKPYLERSDYDKVKVGNMFNLASNFDLEGLRRQSLIDKIPFNILNDNNENLIHIIVRTSSDVIENKRLKIIEYLISKGVNPDLPNNQGVTPLHFACENQYQAIIKYLLLCGSNPNTKDNFGRTPIHYLVSGLIKEWENNQNKPLYYGTRKKQPKNLFKSKVEFKNYVYNSLKENNFESSIANFISKINLTDFINEDLKEINFSDSLSSSDLTERLKTKISEITNQLDGISFNISDILESTDDDSIQIIPTEKIINEYLDKSKNNILELVSKNLESVKSILSKCSINTELTDNDFMKIVTDRRREISVELEPSEYLSYENISPFYPMYNRNLLVVNSQMNIIYTKTEATILNGLIDKLTNNPLSLYYYWLEQSFNNTNNLVDDIITPTIDPGESYQQIKRKLTGLLLNDTDTNKLKSILLLALTLYLYNQDDKEQINELFNDPDYDVSTSVNHNFLKNKLIKAFPDNLSIFMFALPYALIEFDIINKNTNDGKDRILSSWLHLVKFLQMKNMIIPQNEDSKENKIKEIAMFVTKYERRDERFTNYNIFYRNLDTTDTARINEILDMPDNFNALLRRNEFREITNPQLANLFSKDEAKIFFTKFYDWIIPSLKSIMNYHYLVNELDEIELNQSIFCNLILESQFIGNTLNMRVNNTVTTLQPEYISINDVDDTLIEEKKYLVGPNVLKMLKKSICKQLIYYLDILGRGKYPLLKIFYPENKRKFDSYFNKVVPYHLQSLGILELNVNKQIESLSNFENSTEFSKILINYNEYMREINTISQLNYIKIRLSSESDNIEIPNFYYYPLDSDFNSRKLSYGNSDESIDLVEMDDVINNDDKMIEDEYFYSKIKINNEKLRISVKTLPDNLKTIKGLNLLLNLNILKYFSKLDLEKLRGLAFDILQKQNIDDSEFGYELSLRLINNTLKELGDEIINRVLKLQVIDILGQELNNNKVRTILPQIKLENDQNIDFLKSTDFKFTITQETKKISLFPIIKENKVKLPELYFSNDYTADEFVTKLFEIKFNKESLNELINNRGNIFVVDNSNQSPIHLITTNYLIEPYQTLKDAGVDFRQNDENGFNFNEKIEEELKYHDSFINLNKNNFRECIKELIDPFYEGIKNKLNKSSLSGFNHLRYTRLALELPIYYLLANVNILDRLPSKIYPSDLALAKHLVKPKSKINKSRQFTVPRGENIVDVFLKFTDIDFFDSPGVFLDEFENIFKTDKLIDYKQLNSDDAINYFISEKLVEINSVKKIYDIIELSCKQVLTTQIIYLLTNMINAHLKIKFSSLDGNDRARIIEEEILGKIIIREIDAQNLLDIIKNETLPKLLRNTLEIYLDSIDKNESEDYSVFDFTNEITETLKLLPTWFDEKDKLISDVIPIFLNGYLEIYLPEIIRSMRCIIENILKWKINYDKIKKLIN